MADSNKAGYQERAPQPPLYAQVRNTLVRRLVEGVWAEGEMLPSEFDLAADMGVSQGTVRKALDSLAADNLVVRRQGRGTFVAEHDEARILFQFFKLVADSGEASFPESRVVSARSCLANADDEKAMGLPHGAEVVRIHRVRSIGGRPVIAERIVLPAAQFSGLADTEAPNNLYGLYAQRYGVTVARAHERLKAVALPQDEALLLEAQVGAPALLIDRIAYGLDGSVIEWRVSHCLTDDLHYSSDLK